MIVQPETAGDYDLLFTEMNEAMEDLEDTETGAAIQLTPTPVDVGFAVDSRVPTKTIEVDG